VKELTEIVKGTLGLLGWGVLIVSLLGSILPVIRLFFTGRREAKFADYLRGGDAAAKKPARAPSLAPDNSQAGEGLLADLQKRDARKNLECRAGAER